MHARVGDRIVTKGHVIGEHDRDSEVLEAHGGGGGGREGRPIVVGVDDGPEAQLAVRWAVEEASLRRLPLLVVHVASQAPSPAMPMTAEIFSAYVAVAEPSMRGYVDAMDYARDRLPAGMLIGIQPPGRPSKVLVDEAEHGELVVVGTRGRGPLPAAVRGSVSSTVAAHAPRPVVVVRALHDDAQRHHIVVGIDGSPHSDLALGFAFEEAALRRAELTLVHCGRREDDVDGAWDRLVGTRPAQHPGVRARTVWIDGDPTVVLAGYSHSAELVVVGSRGHAVVAGSLLGSVGQGVLRHARCPVAVVH